MGMKIKAKSKVGLYILILTLIIAFEGCIQEKTTNISKETLIVENTSISGQKIAKIIDYKITGDSSGSYIFVNISFKKLPITVHLLDEYGGIIDSKTVKNIRELPIKLYLSGHINIFNESNIIRVTYNGQIADERKIFIHGPKIEILKVYDWDFDKFGEACLLKDVKIIVKNNGDAPAYIKSIKLIGNNMELGSSISMYEYPILPNETKILSASGEFYKRIDSQGTYATLPEGLTFDNATLQLLGPKGEILASTTVSFKVKC